ncbi:hemin uptake protein HemP [Sneathiella sp.]|uniref:hemin uptake protein HemP n=1 Tax=Sneathiella sp. TaxID=1964365 RepID=UPI003561AC3B
MLEGNSGCKSNRRTVSLVNNTLLSKDLFLQGRELTIIHNSEEYKLRLTGNEKLILTK